MTRTVRDFWHEFHSNPAKLEELRFHARGDDGRTEYASNTLSDVVLYVRIRNDTPDVPGGPASAWAKIEILSGK